MSVDHGLLVAHGLERSKHWPAVERAFRKANPTCALCRSAYNIQVHHVAPFHLCILVAKRPDLELDPRNLISLCEPPGPGGCHSKIGHLGDFRTYNPEVRSGKILSPKPLHLGAMSAADKRTFRAWVTSLYGRRPK